MANIELDRVTAGYGSQVVVDKLSLSVAQGECLALLGPSGCGKTTTLNVIAGFAPLAGGAVRIAGRDMSVVPPHRRDIAMVFQSYALFPHLTVGANIAFGLEMRRLPKAEIAGRVERALDLVRLKGFGDRLPKQLSGGQQQRVALARSIAVEPKVLLLDEPLSNLDAQLREEMRFELSDIQKRVGITTVFVTHDQADAMAIADRIVVMNKGRIEQVGTPAELYERPERLFVASFIGRVNLIPGKVVAAAPEATEVAVAGGTVVRCAPRPGMAVGEAVEIAIRPEHMRLAAPGAGAGLAAEVERVTYLGEHKDVALKLAGQPIRVTVPGHLPSPAAGSVAHVSWAAEQARLFGSDGAAA